MVKSIGGKRAVRCREVIRFSEGPLLEVLLTVVDVLIMNTVQQTAAPCLCMKAMHVVDL